MAFRLKPAFLMFVLTAHSVFTLETVHLDLGMRPGEATAPHAHEVKVLPSKLPDPYFEVPPGEPFPYASHEVDRSGLPYLRHDARTWERLVIAFLEGKGSLVGRTPEVVASLNEARKICPSELAGDQIINKLLDWKNVLPTDDVLWDPAAYEDPKKAVLRLNSYPYELAPEAQHYIYWIRSPPVSDASFAQLEGEKVPSNDFLDPERVPALVRYINHYDFYGDYGLKEEMVANIRRSDFAHPTEDVVWTDPDSGQTVNREQGAAAMQWAGRHLSRVLKKKYFPEDKYEVVWDRPPPRYKSVPNPDHFHVIVVPKSPQVDGTKDGKAPVQAVDEGTSVPVDGDAPAHKSATDMPKSREVDGTKDGKAPVQAADGGTSVPVDGDVPAHESATDMPKSREVPETEEGSGSKTQRQI